MSTDLLLGGRSDGLVIYVLMYTFFFLIIRRPPRSTQSRSSAASDVYKRQVLPFEQLIKRSAGRIRKRKIGDIIFRKRMT